MDEDSLFPADDFLLPGAGAFSMDEDVLSPEGSCCLAVAFSMLEHV